MLESTLIGRQPILDINMKQYAYELLFRNSSENGANVLDSQYATSKVLNDALHNFGLDYLIGNSVAFVNMDYQLLMDPVIESIPSKRFVLEILEDVQVDEALIERIAHLKKKGFTLAIDDLDFSEEMMENFRPVLEHTSILKIDLMALDSLEEAAKKIQQLAPYKLTFLAEKVETLEEFEACKKMGFHLFQGYFFAKPTIVEGKKLNPDKLAIMKIISLLQGDSDIKVIENEFTRTPTLTINLLKYLNSASFSFRKEISTIRQALNMVGRSALAQWLTLFVYADDSKDFSGMPLLDTALVRAETMTRLSKQLGYDRSISDKAFLVGLLSFMETIFQARFPEIFSQIRFEKCITEALINRTGELGQLLSAVIILEKAEPEQVEQLLAELNINSKKLSEIVCSSIVCLNGKQQEAA